MRGDPIPIGPNMLPIEFQSAPRILMRGDFCALCSLAQSSLFQSAPRILMRGDKPVAHLLACRNYVSIRAPHSHAGRRLAFNAVDPDIKFQSAPRILMRGDTWC